jgi:hypothetical protein
VQGTTKQTLREQGIKQTLGAQGTCLYGRAVHGTVAHAGNKHICTENTRGWENERVFLKHECEEHVCRMEYEWIRSGIGTYVHGWSNGAGCISVLGSGVPGTFVTGTMVEGTSVLEPRDSNNGAGILYEGSVYREQLYRESIRYMLTYYCMFLTDIFKILCPNKIIKRPVFKFFLGHQKTKKYVFPR